MINIQEQYNNGRRNFIRVDLEGANLEGANLEGATLRWSDLYKANLQNANLKNVNLKNTSVVIPNIHELPYLYKQLLEGNIDGTTYNGKCACLSGTLAHGEDDEDKLPQSIDDTRDSMRPIECFFFRIKPGDTPSNSWEVKDVIKQLELIAKEYNIQL